MTAYSAALFLHVTATLALVSALSLEAMMGWRLRRDAAVGELLLLQGPIPVMSLWEQREGSRPATAQRPTNI